MMLTCNLLFCPRPIDRVLTGLAGLVWGRWPNHRYFALLALVSLGAAIGLMLRYRHLDRLLFRATVASPHG